MASEGAQGDVLITRSITFSLCRFRFIFLKYSVLSYHLPISCQSLPIPFRIKFFGRKPCHSDLICRQGQHGSAWSSVPSALPVPSLARLPLRQHGSLWEPLWTRGPLDMPWGFLMASTHFIHSSLIQPIFDETSHGAVRMHFLNPSNPTHSSSCFFHTLPNCKGLSDPLPLPDPQPLAHRPLPSDSAKQWPPAWT